MQHAVGVLPRREWAIVELRICGLGAGRQPVRRSNPRPGAVTLRAVFQGLGSVLGAIDLITKDSRLRRLAVLPALISAALFSLLIYCSFHYGPMLLDRFWPTASGTEGWHGQILGMAHLAGKLLVTLVLLLLSAAVFFFGSRLVAEPFIDLLSEGTDAAVGVEQSGQRFSIGRLIKDLGLVLLDIAIDIPLFIACHAINFGIGFIPVVGPPIQVVCTWLINATFSAIEMSAIGMARRGVRGWSRWQVAKANRTRILGLGSGVVLLMLVPLAQLVTLPVAVVAGTLVVIELEKEDRLRKPAKAEA